MGFRHQLKPHVPILHLVLGLKSLIEVMESGIQLRQKALPVLVVVKDICHHHRGGCMTLIFLSAVSSQCGTK
ncbi:hypothetical protein ACET3Z_016990 [Daucus carota]